MTGRPALRDLRRVQRPLRLWAAVLPAIDMALRRASAGRAGRQAPTIAAFLELETADLIQRMVAAWIEANWPTESVVNVCRHCRQKDDNLIPLGYGTRPRIWVHHHCSDLFRAESRRAAAALGFDEEDNLLRQRGLKPLTERRLRPPVHSASYRVTRRSHLGPHPHPKRKILSSPRAPIKAPMSQRPPGPRGVVRHPCAEARGRRADGRRRRPGRCEDPEVKQAGPAAAKGSPTAARIAASRARRITRDAAMDWLASTCPLAFGRAM